MSGLTSIKNIRKELERKLIAAGINSPQALAELGLFSDVLKR